MCKPEMMVTWARAVPQAGEERTDSVYISEITLTGLADEYEAGGSEDIPQAEA